MSGLPGWPWWWKTSLPVQETQLQPPGRDPLEEGTATRASVLAWRTAWTEEPGGLQSMGSPRVRQDWSDRTHRCMFQVNREKPAPRPRNLSPLPHPLSSLFLYFLGSFRERIHVLYCFTSSLFFSPKHSFWKTTRLSWLTAREMHPHPTRGQVVCVPSVQPCPVLRDPLDYSPPGIPSSVHGILQTGILEWVSMPSSRRSPQARDWTRVSVSRTGRWVLYRQCLSATNRQRADSVSEGSAGHGREGSGENQRPPQSVQTCPPTVLVCLPYSFSL